jgi:hypothetical protein
MMTRDSPGCLMNRSLKRSTRSGEARRVHRDEEGRRTSVTPSRKPKAAPRGCERKVMLKQARITWMD